MKNRITTILLFIVMLFLIGLIGTLIWIIYEDINNETIVDTIQTTEISTVDETVDVSKTNTGNISDTEEAPSAEIVTNIVEETPTEESSNDKFFYKQLSDTQKIFYDELLENKENMKTGTYVIQFGDKFTSVLEQEDGKETLGDDYQSAIDAYLHDNMDVFYLDVSKLYLSIETTKKTFSTKYNVYIGPQEGETYYDENFSNISQVNTVLNQIETVKNRVLAKLGSDDYSNIKIIHDYLLNNIEYDQYGESIDEYSIYGALVDGKAVCEGYAKAFKYLANAAGIECELIQGNATNSDGVVESHEWNCVYLENKWYYVDVTWDDPIIIGSGVTNSSYNYRYFLKGETTFEKDHVKKYQFVDGGKKFKYPKVSELDY